MMQRMHAILSRFSRSQAKQRRERMINNVLVKSVNTNANGTSGYTVKNGPNKGKVLGHITVKHPNKSYE
ncbi:hypothetical protein OAU47_04415 [Pelagibacterales bacterium]|jgi:hypothetical protein|nr:hypothetical protein [Pelagibacterales bacterium]|tara:strand:+ start:1153 stop:1359 length:207 start_codon:yes stop_codon:yes gene_type:complete